MDPKTRVNVALAWVCNYWNQALKAAKSGDYEGMARDIATAFEMLDPFIRSMEILDASRAKTIKDHMKPQSN